MSKTRVTYSRRTRFEECANVIGRISVDVES